MHVFVDEADRDPLLASLDRIADLPIERVIVPHCETAVFTEGSAHRTAGRNRRARVSGFVFLLRLRTHSVFL